MIYTRRKVWRPTPAYARAVGLPVVLGCTALAFGRVELLLLGAPLLLGVLLARGRFSPLAQAFGAAPIRHAPPSVEVNGPRRLDAGRAAKLATTITPSDAEIVTVLLPPEIQDGDGERVLVQAPTADDNRHIVTEMAITTWGTHELVRPHHLVAGPDGLWVVGPVEAAPFTAQVLPAVTARLPSGPLPPRPAGMVGAHRTRRAGEGTDLHDITPFVPGDRLRRVDWRVTSRQSGPDEQLFTRRTLVDADADVMCCLDNRYDLAADVTTWSAVADVVPDGEGDSVGRTSIDIAVDTVSSIAATYLSHGDRVGMLDLSMPSGMVRPASGSRQLIRIRSHLARHTRRPGAADTTRLARRVPGFPPGAIIVVTSVFLDESMVELAVGWRRAGHPVLAVDVLPDPLRLEPRNRAMSLAVRVVMAERAERMAALLGNGVAVTGADPAQLALRLARLARAPRRSRHR
ncbi:DUF58 domain-containing protein [Phytoactinopolyspora halotolerans]|uniref:DUF58 domain-containing protein n=1 Tax=Phytoactinopolyspora halotolerans TaxID=1981512 RepID=A0A6L9S5B9_9ACTN|nr:DUF58 domain-containing protein [Phytoactinopolyspora halotolerans]NED99833.1 DUF58 domain-containing protein [Phytoactinopolyspora halotolerans]